MQIIKQLKWILLCALIMFIPSGDLIAKQGRSSHKTAHHHPHNHKNSHNSHKKQFSSYKKQSHTQENFSNNHKAASQKKHPSSSQKKNTYRKKLPTSQKKTPAHHPKASHVSQSNYQSYWHKSTFPTNQASIDYHTNKHGNGRSSLRYTQDAVNFHEKNKHLRQPFNLQDGSPGYKIKKGSEGGIWTPSGKVVTFWG